MATKNCPKCSKQVPVACKKCLCGHIFFSTRRGAASTSATASTSRKESATSAGRGKKKQDDLDDFYLPRRTGRLQREKTKFYDALHVDNQMKKDDDDCESESTGKDKLNVSQPAPAMEMEFLHDADIENLMAGPPEDKVFKNILLTVGTTSYDELLDVICNEKTQTQFLKWGTRQVRVQIGDSKVYEEGDDIYSGIVFKFFRFKNSLADDIQWADLIISHAGAGTTLDVLDARKCLLVIPNMALMDNHQVELAQHLDTEQFAFSASLDNFLDIMKTMRKSHIRQFPSKNETAFQKYMENAMGFDPAFVKKVHSSQEDEQPKQQQRQSDQDNLEDLRHHRMRFSL